MPHVLASNAIIIYADRPAELSRWYQEHLGIVSSLNRADSRYYGQLGTWGDGTPVYFGIYPAPTPLGNAPRSVMINYRVEDINTAISQLQSKGIPIEKSVQELYAISLTFAIPRATTSTVDGEEAGRVSK